MKYALLLSFLFSCAHAAKDQKIGDSLPLLTGLNQDSKSIETKNYQKDFTLIYFYPMADTPGCTKQACSIRDSFDVLSKQGVKVLGVSTDRPEAQKKFQKKYKLPFDLIADTEKKWADAFNVPVRMGFASRQAFLFKDGKLVWFDRSASTDEQAQDVLNFIKK